MRISMVFLMGLVIALALMGLGYLLGEIFADIHPHLPVAICVLAHVVATYRGIEKYGVESLPMYGIGFALIWLVFPTSFILVSSGCTVICAPMLYLKSKG